jgi:hypothetical protein
MKSFKLAGVALIAAAATLGLGAASASAAPSDTGSLKSCFRTTDWAGWNSPNPSVLYLKVNVHDVYQVDLKGGSTDLQPAWHHLVSQVRGSTMICSPIDLDLAVADNNGFSTPLFPTAIRKLSPEEVAAIPKKYLP